MLTSVLAGVACSDRHVLDAALSTVARTDMPIHIMDSAPDDIWARIRASVIGRPVQLHTEPMSSAYGAAMLGAALQNGIDWALGNLTSPSHTIEPEEGGEELFSRYLAMSHLIQEAG